MSKASEFLKACKLTEADKVWYLGKDNKLVHEPQDALKFRDDESATEASDEYENKYPDRQVYTTEYLPNKWVVEVDPGDKYKGDDDEDDYGDTLPEILNNLLAEMDLSPDINYSGRGMFGKKCYGVCVSRHSYKKAMDVLKKKVSSTRSDNMGMDMIIYWPGTTYEKIKNELDPQLQSDGDDG